MLYRRNLPRMLQRVWQMHLPALDLDGLVANEEQIYTYDDLP